MAPAPSAIPMSGAWRSCLDSGSRGSSGRHKCIVPLPNSGNHETHRNRQLKTNRAMKIGFIGLGIMGSRMVANLQKHGYRLVLFNRTRAKAQPLLGPCTSFSDSPADLGQQVDVLFTMLAHPDAVEAVALGSNGFLNQLRPNALWIDCSSVNPSFSKKMAAVAAGRGV